MKKKNGTVFLEWKRRGVPEYVRLYIEKFLIISSGFEECGKKKRRNPGRR